MAPAAFFPPVALEEGDDFHHICLTADQLVLTQPLPARSGRFVASFLVSFRCGWSAKTVHVHVQCSQDPQEPVSLGIFPGMMRDDPIFYENIVQS